MDPHTSANVFLLSLLLSIVPSQTARNSPPRFYLPRGQSPIVLRLNGSSTRAGSFLTTIKGIDSDGDPLVFGLQGQVANELFRVGERGRDWAQLYLNKDLDRRVEIEYLFNLTLDDGKLSEPVQQSMAVFMEGMGVHPLGFKPYKPILYIPENEKNKVPYVIATLEATGNNGPVIYLLDLEKGDEAYFTISTTSDQVVLRLVKPLDYERKSFHKIKIVAEDLTKTVDQVRKAVASIVVNVTDEEDLGPAFVPAPHVIEIKEDVPLNSIVLQLRALDGDQAINNQIKYSLLSSNENDPFRIDPDTGTVYTRQLLYREGPRSGSYLLHVLATEQTPLNPKPSVKTTVVINIIDIDTDVPRFKSSLYQGIINENSKKGETVTLMGNSISQTMLQGSNGRFSLRTEGDDGVFEVTPSSGINAVYFVLRVRDPIRLDFEVVTEYNFILVAQDVSSLDKRSTVPVSVKLIDANDNFPKFERDSYETFIDENAPVGTRLMRVRATDADFGLFGSKGIRYRLHPVSSLANQFNMDPLSGLITVNNGSLLDRELIPLFYLTVEAQDDRGMGNRNSVQIAVHLRDDNDNEPVFLQSNYEARVFENEMECVFPVQVQATDNDLKNTSNSQVSYNLIYSSILSEVERWIDVGFTSGIIKIVKPFDFETLSSSTVPSAPNVKTVNFTIRATDGGRPSRFSFATLVFYVFDVNDNDPIFSQSYISRIVREDLIAGAHVGRVVAIDSDGSAPYNTVFYRIEGGGQDKFVIESDTGIIRLSPGASLDNNCKAHHILNVVAFDGGGRLSEGTCIVNVTFRYINKKKFEFIQIQEGLSASSNSTSTRLYSASIVENSPLGTIITQVKASDLYSTSVLRYSIDYNKSEARNEDGKVLTGKELDISKLFRLNPADGQLSLAGLLDREVVEVFELRMVVQDISCETGEQNAWTSLRLQVLDENDNDPKFMLSSYYTTVQENAPKGTNILTVTAEDSDKDQVITYSILISEVEQRKVPLDIDPDTGVIAVVSSIDRESTQWINVTVIAEDSGIHKRQSAVSVVVNVVDENDNLPTFMDNISNVTVPEDTEVGTIIATVVARDGDTGNYRRGTYHLDRNSSDGKFVMDSETGVIRVAEHLDREKQSSYTLVLQTTDNVQFDYVLGASRNAIKQIMVRVSDINDCAPEFVVNDNDAENATYSKTAHPMQSCTSITEFHEGLILVLGAQDCDDETTPNARVSFQIKSGNELGLFTLEVWKNIVKVVAAKSLAGFYGNYTLTIEAVDGGEPQNRASKDYDICVQSSNANMPGSSNTVQNFTIRVPENSKVGSSIVQVSAVDLGGNGVARYRFGLDLFRHWETFQIHPITGILTVAKHLEREKQNVYCLRIEAFDLATAVHFFELNLTIIVENDGDYKPSFLAPSVTVGFTENLNPGRENVTLPPIVEDEDYAAKEGQKTRVCYFIYPDAVNSVDIFELDALTRTLTTRLPLDREKVSAHSFTVYPTDGCYQNASGMVISRLNPGSLLRVSVVVLDVNDNAPRFTQNVFSGGVSTSSQNGTDVLTLSATDNDTTENGRLTYFQVPPMSMAMSNGFFRFVDSESPLFTVDPVTGVISLAFDPHPDMKGHFTLRVGVKDSEGLNDSATVFIYLLRDDQKVKFTVRMSPFKVEQEIGNFRARLANATGAVVNSDQIFKYHENQDGTVDKTKTDFYVHLVHPQKHFVIEAEDALELIDHHIKDLEDLFNEFNVLDTQKASIPLASVARNLYILSAIGMFFLFSLLLLVVLICLAQRANFRRQLEAATIELERIR